MEPYIDLNGNLDLKPSWLCVFFVECRSKVELLGVLMTVDIQGLWISAELQLWFLPSAFFKWAVIPASRFPILWKSRRQLVPPTSDGGGEKLLK